MSGEARQNKGRGLADRKPAEAPPPPPPPASNFIAGRPKGALLFLLFGDFSLDKVLCLLVGSFGFNGPLRQYFSLYRTVSQREGEKGERIDELVVLGLTAL